MALLQIIPSQNPQTKHDFSEKDLDSLSMDDLLLLNQSLDCEHVTLQEEADNLHMRFRELNNKQLETKALSK